MADQEEEDLRMAMRMSMQYSPPEPKRSKPREVPVGAPDGSSKDSPEAKSRRMKRELMATAAEKRMLASRIATPSVGLGSAPKVEKKENKLGAEGVCSGRELSEDEAKQLFSMVFGSEVSKDILAQWTNQGIRFSPDPATSMGLVQHEGGPCGVLAAIQAYVLKYILFFPNELGKVPPGMTQNLSSRRLSESKCVASNNFPSLSEDAKARALVRSMGEILFLCGDNKSISVASLTVITHNVQRSEDGLKEEINAKALEGLSIESASDLKKILRVDAYTSQASAFLRLQKMIPLFKSRMGAMLFLISALLSRGLDFVQADRDDPSLPLVTAPFGHASQEIVNLLLCGQAVPNVFDGKMDLGGDIFLKGISRNVEVGFLTLLESLNFCKVDHLCNTGFIVWSEFWQVILDLDQSLGGLKDSSGLMGKKVFDLYHFNGIAKSDLNGSHVTSGGETPVQRPRLTKLRVSVPPRWTPEEFMAEVPVSSASGGNESSGKDTEVAKPEPSQHAPLVDCIRTRWPRAICNWVGDPPSIV
ncbi:hypothetical protein I3843_15G015200 [Carya illinoinensis]|uniref:Deubiquitinating enzyme MINDY-3/4 conserved domain-containing protein n=1 Tax=Carya illinoinensis TaxID=32201 RepID=A0A922AA87_CARIL|nr:hypothetical protein I3760_15G015600 [Carya illinoinensis]KAG6673937.1 hypothetical protein I3842_15G016300 [Carya illinoinensis]KAG7942977.1 hypothetical protein I3843_15G015200 [Carya illinoinensis]